MDIAVEKFLSFLKIYMEEQVLKKNRAILPIDVNNWYDASKKVNEIYEIKEITPYCRQYNIAHFLEEIFKTSSKDWEESGKVFVDFDLLSDILLKSNLNRKERLEIILNIIIKNRESLENSDAILDYKDVKDLKIEGMTEQEFKDYWKNDFREASKRKEEELTEPEKIFYKKLDEKLVHFTTKNPNIIAQKVVIKHILTKKESFNWTDINITMKAFNILKLDPSLTDELKQVLLKELKKRKTKTINKVSEKKKENVEIPSFSKKEYKLIFREIMEMYDIQDHKIIRALTKDEIIYLVSLMLKINIPEIEIRKSIQNINWHGIEAYNNPVTEFNYNYEKIERNSAIVEVEIAIRNIKEYIQAMIMPEDDTEYSFWKNQIEEELKKIRNILNQDDTYELEEGRKLNRMRAEK